jgi:hypothetical protein
MPSGLLLPFRSGSVSAISGEARGSCIPRIPGAPTRPMCLSQREGRPGGEGRSKAADLARTAVMR